MFDNSALDVAIGLFFIYALYSLIATTLTEMIASLLHQRGGVLKRGIKRMLNNEIPEKDYEEADGKPDKSLNNEKIISHSPKEEENKKLAYNLGEVFFKRPAITYLKSKSLIKTSRFPSYIKPKTFCRALLDTMGFDINVDKDLSRIRGMLDPKNETHKMIIDLIDQSKENVDNFKVLLEEWFNEIMDRVAGWYKRRIQMFTFLISAIIAFSLNINTIEISRKLGTDDELRQAIIQPAVAYSKYVSNDTVAFTDDKKFKLLTARMDTLIEKSNKVSSIIEIQYPFCKENKDGVNWLSYLFGCLLTAIALSLGAPFWFDLLNKLIKLRSSGNQEKTNNSTPVTKSPVG